MEWKDRRRIYVPMTFNDNPSSATNDKFDQAADYGMILLYTKYPLEMSLKEMAASLKSPACLNALKRTLENETLTYEEKQDQFLR